MVLWLSVLGAAATIVGGHDAGFGSEVSVRVLGTFVLISGLVLIAGAAGLRQGRPLGRALAIVAALLGIALGVSALITQAVNGEPDGWLAAWAAIVVLSAVSAWHVRASTPPTERPRTVWSQLPFLKSAVSIGALASLAQFWYTSIYLPTTAPASLTIESRLRKVGETRTRLILKGSVTIHNTSDTRVNVLGSSMDVTAETLRDDALDHSAFRDAVRTADHIADYQAERYTAITKETLVSHARPVIDGTYFEPDERVTVTIVTWIPRNRYDRVSFRSTIAIARGRVLAVETERPQPRTTREGVTVLTRVPDAGWLRALTRHDRFVRAEYASNIGGLAGLTYRELQVADLLSRDRSSREIADKIAQEIYSRPTLRTVDRHVRKVLAKLNVARRSEVQTALERAGRGLQVWFAPNRQPDPPQKFDKRLKRFYGYATASGTDTMSLPPDE